MPSPIVMAFDLVDSLRRRIDGLEALRDEDDEVVDRANFIGMILRGSGGGGRFAYDPNEPRDDQGQWTTEGGSEGSGGSSGEGSAPAGPGSGQRTDLKDLKTVSEIKQAIESDTGGFTVYPADGMSVAQYREKAGAVRDQISSLQERFPGLRQTGPMSTGSPMVVFGIDLVKGRAFANKSGSDSHGDYNRASFLMRVSSSLNRSLGVLRPGQWLVGSDLGSVVRHELGHSSQGYFEHVVRENNGFGIVDSSFYPVSTLFKESRATTGRTLSKYSALDYHEWFAENFSAYTHPKYGEGSLRVDRKLGELFDKVYKRS